MADMRIPGRLRRLVSQAEERHPTKGLPLALDRDAESADPNKPAFLARPEGAPVYHGFPILADVNVDGFTLGLISDSFGSPSVWGDAFVIGPDGRRAGLVWSIEGDRYFNILLPSGGARFGVFGVGTKNAPRSTETAVAFLQEILPSVRDEWEKTRPT